MPFNGEYRLIVTGPKGYFDAAALHTAIEQHRARHSQGNQLAIISGLHSEIEREAAEVAQQLGLRCYRFPPKARASGKPHLYARNERMASLGHGLLAWSDGDAKEVLHLIDAARYWGLDTEVLPVETVSAG